MQIVRLAGRWMDGLCPRSRTYPVRVILQRWAVNDETLLASGVSLLEVPVAGVSAQRGRSLTRTRAPVAEDHLVGCSAERAPLRVYRVVEMGEGAEAGS